MPAHVDRRRADVLAVLADLARPTPVGAALVLAVNDHLLKGAGVLPGAVTGKLSDVAGLFVAGLVAVTALRVVAALRGRPLPRRDGSAALLALVAVGGAFSALKLWPAYNRAVEAVWGANVLDASDLWTLPALALSRVWLRDREHAAVAPRPPRGFPTAALAAAVLLACAATPAVRIPPRPVVAWQLGEPQALATCASLEPWVSKSGKTGAGITLVLRTPEGCDTALAAMTMHLPAIGALPALDVVGEVIVPAPPAADDERAAAAVASTPEPTGAPLAGPRPLQVAVDPAAPAPATAPGPELAPARLERYYVAFVFDNEARWNQGLRDATFTFELTEAGQRRTWLVPARQGRVTAEPR